MQGVIQALILICVCASAWQVCSSEIFKCLVATDVTGKVSHSWYYRRDVHSKEIYWLTYLIPF